MLDILLDRRWKKPAYSIGRIFANGNYLGNTMEPTDRGLVSTMSEAIIRAAKIAGKTAIPLGTYRVILSRSPKFSGRVWAKKYEGLVPEILGVPGFSSIRIHPGCLPKDTSGCPLTGDNKQVGRLSNSQRRYYQLMDSYLIPAWEKGEEIKITVK